MKEKDDTKTPLHSGDALEGNTLSSTKPFRLGPLLLNHGPSVSGSNTPPPTTPGKGIATAKRNETGSFRIIVAARIRPFTELEVRQWRQERRAGAEEGEDAGTLRNSGTRSIARQPYCIEHRSLLPALPVSAIGSGSAVSQELGALHPDGGHPPINTHDMLMPVVEVESDGRTIVLLDPQRRSTDPNATAQVRNAFTYDCVFSSFPPSVTLGASLTGSFALSSGAVSPAAAIEPSNIAAQDAGERSPTLALGCSLSTHTPEHERQAEEEQVAIYEQLAVPLVSAALEGYNTCMFAYGQTGSGKTYTMMGTPGHPGLIPRLCESLFTQVATRNAKANKGDVGSSSTPSASVKLSLSYMEIYKEQVRDLLKQRPKNAIVRYRSRFDKKEIDSDEYRSLKVRHHPSKGIYVEGLTSVSVSTWAECEEFLQHGNSLRTQCNTAVNAKSSRSHAIFQLTVTQREATGGRVRGREVALETSSKINLVDLAGSERNTNSKTTDKHLAEANSINASLSTLRRVLNGLVNGRDAAANGNSQSLFGGGGRGKKQTVLPYRESLLTYVLSDNLGGNSLTVMCANVSPGVWNMSETESTLRYAMLARSVVNHARINKTPTARLIGEMREQIKVMHEALQRAPNPAHITELKEGVLLSEQILREMRTREEMYELRLQSSEALQKDLQKALETHKTGEAYWRAEAQRHKDTLESLCATLVAGAARSSPADALGDSEEVRLKASASAQSRVSLKNGDADLVRWIQDDGTAHARRSPLAERKTENAARPHPGMDSGSCSAGKDTVAFKEAEAGPRSPVPHVPWPPDTHRSPLSPDGFREEASLLGGVLARLQGDSTISAPLKTLHEQSRRAPAAASPKHRKARSLSQKLSSPTTLSEHGQRQPRLPNQNPEHRRLSYTILSSESSPKPTVAVAAEEAAGISLPAGYPSGLSAPQKGDRGSDTVAKRVASTEGMTLHEPSTHLTPPGATTEGKRSLSTSCDALPSLDGPGIDMVAGNAGKKKRSQPSLQRGRYRGSRVPNLQGDILEMYKQKNTGKRLSEHALGTRSSGDRASDKHIAIQMDAAFPVSSSLSTRPPPVSQAPPAKHARNRIRSSVTAESVLNPKTAGPRTSIDQICNNDPYTPSSAHRLPPLQPSHHKKGSYAYPYGLVNDQESLSQSYRGTRDGDGVQSMSHLYTLSGGGDDVDVDIDNDDDDGLFMTEEVIGGLEDVTEMLPSARGCWYSGEHVDYTNVDVASESAVASVASVAAAIAPSSGLMLSRSFHRKPKQDGGAHASMYRTPPIRDRYYSTVDTLSPPAAF